MACTVDAPDHIRARGERLGSSSTARRRRDKKRPRSHTDSDAEVRRICRSIDALSWLRRSERSLLHHFVTQASSVVIASHHGQRLFCQTIVPLALQDPSLLYATLAFASAQRAALKPDVLVDIQVVDHSTSKYVSLSMAALQVALPRADRASKASLLATSLMLCLVSFWSGDAGLGSWRAHAQGAKAILASIRHSPAATSRTSSSDIDGVISFLSRWYLSLESLTSLTASGLITGQCVVLDSTDGVITEPTTFILDVCDDHFSYPTRLALVLREIGAASWERRREHSVDRSGQSPSAYLTQRDLDLIADNLHARLTQLSADVLNSSGELLFYPGVREELSETDVAGFRGCTEAFICMARIMIERRIKGTRRDSLVVQTLTRRIIEAVSSITPSPAPSPAGSIGPLLLAAGCEATEECDRQAIRDVLVGVLSKIRPRCTQRALSTLETIWQSDHTPNPDEYAYEEPYVWDYLPW